jgi:1,2-diacylglycerol 3-alpha-glucosyltransferase
MRIAHLCLSCFYIDDFNYQENVIPRYNKRSGNEVYIIASTEVYDAERRLSYLSAGKYVSSDGIRVERMPYVGWLPLALAKKTRIHPGIYRKLEEFGPDVILFHGLCGFELLTVARYKRNHPQVRLFADSHEDGNNSARTWFSKHVLHRLYYGMIARRAAREIERIFCVSLETIDFVRSTYRIPEVKLEYLPLGGEVLEDPEFRRVRTDVRARHGFRDDEIIVVQGGKMGRRKKLLETLKVFRKVDPVRCRLVLVGAIDDSIRAEVDALMKGVARVEFLGWKSGAEVTKLLCGADVYLQPGTQSALLQNAICARCAIIAADVPSHKPFLRGNGWLVDSTEALEGAIRQLDSGTTDLAAMRAASAAVAADLLDYARISERAIGR